MFHALIWKFKKMAHALIISKNSLDTVFFKPNVINLMNNKLLFYR